MNEAIETTREILKNFLESLRYGFFSLILTASWTYTITSAYLARPYGVYPVRKLLEGIIVFPALFFLITLILGKLIPFITEQPFRKTLFPWAWISLAAATLIAFVFPPPVPDLSQVHRLQILPLVTPGEPSQSKVVKVVEIQYMNGEHIPFQNFVFSGDWQIRDNTLISSGSETSIAELNGPMPGGVIITLDTSRDSGKVAMVWDGQRMEYELNSTQPGTLKAPFKGFSWSGSSISHILIVLGLAGIYWLGLASAIFIAAAIYLSAVKFKFSVFDKSLVRLIVATLYLVSLAFFIRTKLSYADFNAEIFFRDTLSYARTAEKPLTSLAFWAGERSFSLPLFYKLLRVNTSNYTLPEVMRKVALVQVWLSVAGWCVLAMTLAKAVPRWLARWSAFTCILAFSLSLEISLWDRLMLSESLTLSLLALLVTAWIWWFKTLEDEGSRKAIAWFGVVFGLTVLYSFTRDSNQFFVLVAAIVFAAVAWTKKGGKSMGIHSLIYLVAVGLIFTYQNWSVDAGRRWQIMIYDRLTLDILHDPQATEFFSSKGLPVSEALLQTREMRGAISQKYMLESAEMGPVRQWVETQGQGAYLAYLVSRPLATLLEPIREAGSLASGDVSSYRDPDHELPPVPGRIVTVSNLFYPRLPAVLFAFLGLILIGGLMQWIQKGSRQATWLVIVALVVSLYPLMFIAWFGNPMEIERHALQVGVQLRLAGWMGLALWVNRIPSQGLIRAAKVSVERIGLQRFAK